MSEANHRKIEDNLILVDPAGTSLPPDIVKLNNRLRVEHLPQEPSAGSASDLRNLGPKSAIAGDTKVSDSGMDSYPLERWEVRLHTFTRELNANIGFFAGLFGGKAADVKAGVVHEAKRYSLVQVEGDTEMYAEVGVAVRLSAASTSVSGEMEISLFNLAAEAQLKKNDSRVGISIIGYSGALQNLLPAPKNLNVETCVEYLQSFEKIQEMVFGSEATSCIVPTTISFQNKRFG